MGLFDKRTNFKPFEYPEVTAYKDAISNSFWLIGHFNVLSDVHDFKVTLKPHERNAIKNTLLAISQIEVNVKRFWTKLGDRLPKPEIEQVGVTFGESEVRHADAYSKLLEVLGLNDQYNQLLENPVIQGRVDYLTKYLKGASDNADENYTLTLALFSIFVENVSLFSQFLIIKSFAKLQKTLNNIDNVVQATAKEEVVHALFGVYLIKKIREENPGWFGPEFEAKILRACKKAYDAEANIIDWIFEAGELDFLPKATVLEFTKQRFNDSLAMIGLAPAFEVDRERVESVGWFEEEVHAEVNPDFFFKKHVGYSKFTQSVTEMDLF